MLPSGKKKEVAPPLQPLLPYVLHALQLLQLNAAQAELFDHLAPLHALGPLSALGEAALARHVGAHGGEKAVVHVDEH
jgi:hypothetical protein